MFCPNCGTKNNPKSHFCKNCGFDLAKYKQKQRTTNQSVNRVNSNSSRRHQATNIQQPLRRQSIKRRPRPTVRPQMMPPKRKHHKGLIASISIVVILAILVFGGVYTYNHNVFPFGNGPLSSLSQSSSSNNDQVIKDVWQRVNNKLGSEASNSGSDDFTDDFQGGTNNSAYHTVNGWTNLENNADSNNDTKVDRIKPYDIKDNGNGKYTYKVRYNFIINDNGDTYHHIQVFDWKSHVKNGKIVSMNSPKTPETDYKE